MKKRDVTTRFVAAGTVLVPVPTLTPNELQIYCNRNNDNVVEYIAYVQRFTLHSQWVSQGWCLVMHVVSLCCFGALLTKEATLATSTISLFLQAASEFIFKNVHSHHTSEIWGKHLF